MGEDAEKRNTDCVYFLASPLTCKKGNDCEYRHSEAARVNPRDCWYWLNGNCLNANCSFRHPPLDGRPAASASTPLPITGGSSAATTSAAASGIASSAAAPALPAAGKSRVPCFYFTQGFCAKGGKCPFMHCPPAHFRKEATTYRKPQASEQPASAEGNGVSAMKQLPEGIKLSSQIRSPSKACSSQEGCPIPSFSYKLTIPVGSMSSAPLDKHLTLSAGNKADQFSGTDRLKQIHNVDERSRLDQSAGNRIPQSQFGNECLQQVPPGDKGVVRGQLSNLDLPPRGIHKQGRQSNLTYNVRTREGFLSSEMQEMVVEQEVQHCIRELHAGDLRNRLVKRRRNDNTYLSEPSSLHMKEHSGDILESGHLASRAISVLESKDSLPINSKRAKQGKDTSTFTGPKSLAQIKAEKTKAGTEGSSKAAEVLDALKGHAQCNSDHTNAPDTETKREIPPASELHDEMHFEDFSNGYGKENLGCHGMASVSDFEEPKPPRVLLKEKQVSVSCDIEGFEGCGQKPAVMRLGVSTKNVDGPSTDLVSLGVSKEVDSGPFAQNFAVNPSKDARKHDGHQLDGGLSSSLISHGKEGNQLRRGSGNEGIAKGSTCSYYDIDGDGNGTESNYTSADVGMDDGTEAVDNATDADYVFDDEEDDFARKLGGFLS